MPLLPDEEKRVTLYDPKSGDPFKLQPKADSFYYVRKGFLINKPTDEQLVIMKANVKAEADAKLEAQIKSDMIKEIETQEVKKRVAENIKAERAIAIKIKAELKATKVKLEASEEKATEVKATEVKATKVKKTKE